MTPRLKEGTRLFTYTAELTKRTSVPMVLRSVMGISSSTGTIPLSKGAPAGTLHVELGVPLLINVENAVAAMAVAYLCGATLEELAAGVASFRGVYRRFDRLIDDPRCVLIDDYAHHPQ